MRRFLLSLLLLGACLALSGEAQAQIADDWTDCAGNAGSTTPDVQPGWSWCLEFTSTYGTGTTSFVVDAPAATVSLARDILAAGGTAQVSFYFCPTQLTPSALTCPELVKTFTADDSEAVGRGTYYVVVDTAPGAGDHAVFGVTAW